MDQISIVNTSQSCAQSITGYEIAKAEYIAQMMKQTQTKYKPTLGDAILCELPEKMECETNAIVTKINKQRTGCIITYNTTPCIMFSKNFEGYCLSASGGPQPCHEFLFEQDFELIGQVGRTFWTWNRNGVGANQGFYFTLPVNQWRLKNYELKQRDNKGFNEMEFITQYNGLKFYEGETKEGVKIYNVMTSEYIPCTGYAEQDYFLKLHRITKTNPFKPQ